jgi:hypothetical protein
MSVPFSQSVLDARRRDAAMWRNYVFYDIAGAIAAAERFEFMSLNQCLDEAQGKISKLRMELEDLAAEREREEDEKSAKQRKESQC